MENNSSNQNNGKTGIFSFLYRTRVVITKEDATVINLSILFIIISLLFAPWVVILGAVAALALGYHFAIDRNAAGFNGDFSRVVKNAADSVKNVVENVRNSQQSTETKQTQEAPETHQDSAQDGQA